MSSTSLDSGRAGSLLGVEGPEGTLEVGRNLGEGIRIGLEEAGH